MATYPRLLRRKSKPSEPQLVNDHLITANVGRQCRPCSRRGA